MELFSLTGLVYTPKKDYIIDLGKGLLLETYLIFTSFPTWKKAHVVGQWTWAMNIRTFWNSLPYSSRAMKVGRRTFDSFHHICLRRRRWGLELIAAVGTKHKRNSIKDLVVEIFRCFQNILGNLVRSTHLVALIPVDCTPKTPVKRKFHKISRRSTLLK